MIVKVMSDYVRLGLFSEVWTWLFQFRWVQAWFKIWQARLGLVRPVYAMLGRVWPY